MVALARSPPSLPQSADDSAFAADVLAGLAARPKRLPPKYFYDADRLGAVRAHHRAAGILPDALRDEDLARPRARHRRS